MKILQAIFYSYTRWFNRVNANKYSIILSSFMFLGLVIIIPLCVAMDTFTTLREKGQHTEFIIITVIIVYTVLYFVILHNGKAKVIMQTKPKLFNSDIITTLITITLTLFVIGLTLWRAFEDTVIKNLGK